MKHDPLTCQDEDHTCMDAQLEASEYVGLSKIASCLNCGLAAFLSEYGPMHITKNGLKLECYGSSIASLGKAEIKP